MKINVRQQVDPVTNFCTRDVVMELDNAISIKIKATEFEDLQRQMLWFANQFIIFDLFSRLLHDHDTTSMNPGPDLEGVPHPEGGRVYSLRIPACGDHPAAIVKCWFDGGGLQGVWFEPIGQ